MQRSIQSGLLKTIPDNKLVSFAVGQQKKSRFQQAREEKEQKKKEEDREAAAVYESFVKSFHEDPSSNKAFVRASKDGGQSYDHHTTIKSKNSEMDKIMQEMKDMDAERRVRSSTSNSHHKSKQIDDLMNEFNSKPSSSSSSSSYQSFGDMMSFDDDMMDAKGSHDTGDAHSTNIFISYLAPTVTEEQLYDLFIKYGPINSIKVMWPRSEEERLRKRNCGFVSYMQRAHAEDALMFLQGYEVGGHAMVMGWGKSCRINAAPVTRAGVSSGHHPISSIPSSSYNQPSVSMISSSSSSPHISKWDMPPMIVPAPPIQIITDPSSSTASSSSPSSPSSPSSSSSSSYMPPPPPSPYKTGMPCIAIHMPAHAGVRNAIDMLARYVAADGEQLEKVVRAREANNPTFRFLEQPDSPDGWYYRWKTYSLLMGDTAVRWHGEAFQISVGGVYLIPPPPPPPLPDHHIISHDDHHRSRSDSIISSSDDHHHKRYRRNDDDHHMDHHRHDDRQRYANMTGAQIERMRKQEHHHNHDDDYHINDIEYHNLVHGGEVLLSKQAYQTWSHHLHHHTSLSRHDIKKAMGFAYDHIDSSQEVVKMLYDAIIDDPSSSSSPPPPSSSSSSTSPPHRISLLYIISDILYNASSSIKHASYYRILIQYYLPAIFDHIGGMYRGIAGRMTAKHIETRVMNILSVWKDWSIYPSLFIIGLEAMFYMNEAELSRQRDFIDANISLMPSSYTSSMISSSSSQSLSSSSSSSAVMSYEDIEVLRKRARMSGVVSYKDTSAAMMMIRLQYVESYAKMKLGFHDVVAEHDMMTKMMIPDDDDHHHQPSSSTVVDHHDDADDIDGAPLPEASYDDVDDDIDGVPMDDIDGAPLPDDEDIDDIDGMPMDDDDAVTQHHDDMDGEPMS